MNTQPENVIPMVIESGARGERAFDIYSLLLRERIVMLGMPINDQVANVIIAQLLFLEREDPDKEHLYNKFIDHFYKAFQEDEIKYFKVPYNDTFLPAMQIQPIDTEKRGTLVLHGGFDSFNEELYFLMRYFSDYGYEVIAFDGPGQGGALKKYGLSWDYEWEKPTMAILDYFKLIDVNLLGISMGGWFCIIAAAF